VLSSFEVLKVLVESRGSLNFLVRFTSFLRGGISCTEHTVGFKIDLGFIGAAMD
jgi:hypothetical protein